ncbi:MAG TPA: nicotinamide riboside transporter PnuC [Candidatus Dorea intestinavium]|nr:nicotinamide riboside transporter PnuC [Candidatus Dorea intestinavium]
MNIFKEFIELTKMEKLIWSLSVVVISGSFFLFGESNKLILIASLIGVTSLIFVAKGNVLGQILMVIFSLIYGLISYDFRYYGEMITYLGMTAPIAVLSIVSWVRNPFAEKKAEVKVAEITKGKLYLMLILTLLVTYGFYFVLAYFKTNNLFLSTISIATSFMASYLMFFRISFYALAYAANDIVLILLWILATKENPTYFSMVICFIMFLANDIYGFINWARMKQNQEVVTKAA